MLKYTVGILIVLISLNCPSFGQTSTQPSRDYNVLDFCRATDLNGANDNSACIQAGINALCPSSGQSGGTLYFPPGIYMITGISVPCEGVVLLGSNGGNPTLASLSGTQIRTLNANGPAILFAKAGTSVNYAYGGGVRNIAFSNNWGGASPGAKPTIEVRYFSGVILENLFFDQPFQPVKIVAGVQNLVRNMYFNYILPQGLGIEITGSGASANAAAQANRNDVTRIENVAMTMGSNSPQHGTCMWIHGFTATIQAKSVSCNNGYNGVVVDCSGGGATDISGCPQFLFMYDIEMDFFDNFGLVAKDFQYLQCYGCYFHGSNGTNNAINLSNSTFTKSFDAQIYGGKIDGAGGSCIWSNVQNTRVIGVDISNCNAGNIGGAGVEISNPTGGEGGGAVVANNSFCRYAGTTPRIMAAVLVGTGVDYTIVQGNVFRGCYSGVVNNSNAQHNSFVSNVGP